jgi:hypothetical protein
MDVSEISEGNKIPLKWQLDSSIQQVSGDSARAGIWKEDELTDPVTGKFYPCQTSRELDYEYGFEIVLNKEPALEKC